MRVIPKRYGTIKIMETVMVVDSLTYRGRLLIITVVMGVVKAMFFWKIG